MLVLQGSDRSRAAKWLFVVIVTIQWIIVMVVVGRFRGVEYFFPAVVVLPVLLFSKREKKGQIFCLLFMVCAFFVAIDLQARVPGVLPISEAFFNAAYYMNAVLLAITLFLLVNFYNSFAASSFRDLELQKNRTDELVHSLLPAYVADRVRDQQSTVADWHSEATVLFAQSEASIRFTKGFLRFSWSRC